MKKTLFTVLILGIVSFLNAEAPNIDIDVIISPVVNQNAPKKVQKPEAVKTVSIKNSSTGETKQVQAATMQDAVNEVVGRDFTEEVVEIKTSSGVGYVASGKGYYKEYNNRNATLISQKEAYMTALLKAKGALAKYLDGLSISAKNELVETVLSADTDNETAVSRSSLGLEQIEASVNTILQGYVIYEVKEDKEEKRITVRIVSSPRTRGAGISLSPVAIKAYDYRSAFEKLYAELRTGLLPPEGARVFKCKDANGNEQLFCVGFGSSIVRTHKDPQTKAELKRSAKLTSSLRATRNLVGLLQGDKTMWKTGHISFTGNAMTDPGMKELQDKVDSEDIHKASPEAQEIQTEFQNITKQSNSYSSIVAGKLPAGVKEYSWIDNEGDWAYTLLIYYQSMTASMNTQKNQVEIVQTIPPDAANKSDADKKNAKIDGIGTAPADKKNEVPPKTVKPIQSFKANDADL